MRQGFTICSKSRLPVTSPAVLAPSPRPSASVPSRSRRPARCPFAIHQASASATHSPPPNREREQMRTRTVSVRVRFCSCSRLSLHPSLSPSPSPSHALPICALCTHSRHPTHPYPPHPFALSHPRATPSMLAPSSPARAVPIRSRHPHPLAPSPPVRAVLTRSRHPHPLAPSSPARAVPTRSHRSQGSLPHVVTGYLSFWTRARGLDYRFSRFWQISPCWYPIQAFNHDLRVRIRLLWYCLPDTSLYGTPHEPIRLALVFTSWWCVPCYFRSQRRIAFQAQCVPFARPPRISAQSGSNRKCGITST